MALQLVLLASLVAVATAAPQSLPTTPNYGHSASAYAEDMKPVDADYDSNPEYSFSYEVHDELSGDVKSHQEARHGDVVEGFYTLIEPDGHRRIVEYKADGQSGFNAVVRREPVGNRKVYNNGGQTAGYNVNDYQH